MRIKQGDSLGYYQGILLLIGFGLSLEQRVSLRAVLDGTQSVLPR